jgi:hypothetical protein
MSVSRPSEGGAGGKERMSRKFMGPAAAVAAAMMGLLAAAPTASAHHSFAMYDNDHQIKVTGTVTHFQWTNPHVYIELDDNDTAAQVKRWTIECANPGILDRVGWKFNMIKPGDKLVVIVAPLRSGESGALLKQVTLADGRVFGNGAPAGKANIQ